MTEAITVLLVDDHILVRRGFRRLLEDDPGIVVVGEASNASEAIRIVKTPVRAPKANAVAERFVGTARRECLDWLLITGRCHLERVLHIYIDHYIAA